MKRFIFPVLFIFLLASSAIGQTSDADAREIAGKILDLANNTVWPDGSGPSDGSPIKICIVGETPVKGALEKLAASSSKTLEITTASDNLSSFHVVYNPSSEISSLAAILKQVSSSKILTISSAKDFARYGIMVNLAKKDGNSELTYEVNTMVLDGSGIKLDASIMKKAVKI